jgi:hypothetical protein
MSGYLPRCRKPFTSNARADFGAVRRLGELLALHSRFTFVKHRRPGSVLRGESKQFRFPQQGWLRVDNAMVREWVGTPALEESATLDLWVDNQDDLQRALEELNERMKELAPERIQRIVNQTNSEGHRYRSKAERSKPVQMSVPRLRRADSNETGWVIRRSRAHSTRRQARTEHAWESACALPESPQGIRLRRTRCRATDTR